MRKITLLLSLLMCVVFANAQNLLTNPSFENWTEGNPDGWSLTSNAGSVTKNTSIVKQGDSSIKFVPTKTFNMFQGVSVDAGATYTLSLSYYIEAGDGTDARIWCNFKKESGYFAEADLVATGLYPILRGPGNQNSSGTSYFADEKGAWKTYTVDITIPDNAVEFDFQVRTYNKATVYWDDFSFVKKGGSSVDNPSVEARSIYVSDGTIYFEALGGETVEVYNTVGQKIVSQTALNGLNSINPNAKGILIVKVGKEIAKVRL